MPNWCANQIDIKGDEVEIKKLTELVKGENGDFDFSKVVPTPDSAFYVISEGQNDFQCGCKQVWVEDDTLPEVKSYTDKDGNDVMRKDGAWRVDGVLVEKVLSSNGTIEDDTKMPFGGSPMCPIHKVKQNSSHPYWWYNWNVENWGTKWNCAEIWHDRSDQINNATDGQTSYNFDTAWSPAEPVVAALAEQFPTLSITHRYCEGGMGYAGQVVYLKGDEVSRDEYEFGDSLPDEAYIQELDGSRGYERDYDKVPMNAMESFCDEYFGGIVGG
jgi:hypothetical protein